MARRARVDVRTKTMSVEALECRSLGGHAYTRVPIPAIERAELNKLGQRKIKVVCGRGCSRWRAITVDKATGEIISREGDYSDPKTYLVQDRGTGRLPSDAARVAFFMAVPD